VVSPISEMPAPVLLGWTAHKVPAFVAKVSSQKAVSIGMTDETDGTSLIIGGG